MASDDYRKAIAAQMAAAGLIAPTTDDESPVVQPPGLPMMGSRVPVPMADAGTGPAMPSAPPDSMMHPDLSMPMSKAPPAVVYAPNVDAAEAERLQQQDKNSAAGMRVAAANAFQHRQDEAAGKEPEPSPEGGVAYKPSGASQAMVPTAGRGGAGGGGMSTKALFSPFEAEKRAIADEATATQHGNDNDAVAQALIGQEIGKQREDISAKARDRDADISGRLAKMDAASKEAASQKIDPERWWKSKDLGQQILYALSSALGGFSAGLRGGRNQALDHINGLIDRDIDAQKHEIESKHGRVGDMRGMLAEQYKRFGNMEQAEAATRALSLEQLGRQQQSYAVGAKNELVDARSRQLQAQLDERIAMEKWKLLHAGTGKLNLPKSDKVVPLGNGRGVVASSEQEAAKLREKIGYRDALKENANELIRLENGASYADKINPYSAYNVRREQLIEQALPTIAVAAGQGAMSKDDAAHAEAAFGAMKGLSRLAGDQTSGLKNFASRIEKNTDAFIRGQNGQVVQAVTVPDANGIPQQHWVPTGETYGPEAKSAGGDRGYTLIPAGSEAPSK